MFSHEYRLYNHFILYAVNPSKYPFCINDTKEIKLEFENLANAVIQSNTELHSQKQI